MSKAKIGAILLGLLLAFYLVIMAQRGWVMITDDNPVAKALGIGLLALPVLGAWALYREMMFGVRMERLAKQLAEEGGLPVDNLPRTPGGRIVREAADAEFEKYQRAAEQAPADWRSWFRLSCAYDAAGDRKRARATMRQAISLERARPDSAQQPD